MKSFQFTLYEIFGYCIPGIAAFVGLYLVFWRVFLAPHQDWRGLSTGGWWALLVIAYILGHFVQSLANTKFDESKRKEKVRLFAGFSVAVRSQMKHVAGAAAGKDSGTDLDAETVFEVAKSRLLQHGKAETREIYIYREGFYRGMALALLVLAVGFLVRFVPDGAKFHAAGVGINASGPVFFANAIVAVLMSHFFYERYKRFLGYRIKFIYYSLLTVEHPVAVSQG